MIRPPVWPENRANGAVVYVRRSVTAGSATLKTLRSRGHRVLLELLIEARKKAGLTQRQLAARLSRTKSYVDRIESGDQIPDPLECRVWASACGVTGWAFWWRLETRMKRHV